MRRNVTLVAGVDPFQKYDQKLLEMVAQYFSERQDAAKVETLNCWKAPTRRVVHVPCA